jgi:hypothetical protein
MEDISREEKSRAIKISQALEHFFEENRGTPELRSTDAYDVLVTKNLVERDRSKGFFFREFLKKLKRAGALGYIPQCRLEGTEWHFRPAGKRALGSGNLRPVNAVAVPAADGSVLNRLQEQIAKLPRALGKKFTPAQLEKRKAYFRAYEQWSETEMTLLSEAAALNPDLQELSRLFGRQPSVLEYKLNGSTGPRLNVYSRLSTDN